MSEVDIELLTKRHDRVSFDCGEPRQNDFLQNRARKHAEQKFSQTWVATTGGRAEILGFITLSMGQIEFANAPEEIVRGLPRYPIPVLHIGQLATNLRYQGKGVGSMLLAFSCRKAVELSQSVGCYAVDLVAQAEKAFGYYLRRGFLPLSAESHRLVMPVKSLADAFK